MNIFYLVLLVNVSILKMIRIPIEPELGASCNDSHGIVSIVALHKNICCYPSLELSWQDRSNEGSQHIFYLREIINDIPRIITDSFLNYLELYKAIPLGSLLIFDKSLKL